MWWKNEKRAYGSIVLMLIVSIALGSCRSNDDEEPIEIREFPGVKEELWPYFIRFEDEGRARGVTINLAATGSQPQLSKFKRIMWREYATSILEHPMIW